jgi:hypothetical protein
VKCCHTPAGLASLSPVNATRRRALLSAIVIALSLAGCAEPGAELAGERTGAAPIPSPSVVPQPVKPPEADQHDERGARQFTLYWFKTVNYAVLTGDIKPFRAASHHQCEPCETIVQAVQENYGDGGYAEGGTFTIRTTEAQNFALADQPSIAVTFDRSAQSSLAPDGQIRGSKPPASFKDAQIVLVKVGRSWQVRTVFGDSLVD